MAAVARAHGAGLPLIDQTPRPGLAGTIAFLHPKASQGVLVEMAQPPASPGRASPSPNPSKSPRVEGVYVATAAPAGAAETLARNLGGLLGAPEKDAGLDARLTTITLGGSRLCVLTPAGPASPVSGWLAERGEGLFGVGLRLDDLDAARRRLEAAGVPVHAPAAEPIRWRIRIEPTHAHGLHLLLG